MSGAAPSGGDEGRIEVERPSSRVAVVRIVRPSRRNALNMALRRELATHFRLLAEDEDVHCLILAGQPEAFAAGADINEMNVGPVTLMRRGMHRLSAAIADCPKPVIAAVRGYAYGGGCELAQLCDIIVAGEGASFAQPEVKVGIMPGNGGTQRLARAIGKHRAMLMLLTGKPMGAREAFEAGLVSRVVQDDQVEAEALEIATTIAGMPRLAVEQIKEVLLAGQDVALPTALTLERKANQLLYDSEDQKEAYRAFKEKRRPTFRGR